MKFLEVSADDMKMLGQLINMLNTGNFSMNGKDICASADTIRWLQGIGTEAAKVYRDVKSPISSPPTSVVSSPPIGEGISIKSVGKAGKK